jgi:rhamnopyranosyl-N-acetylglucosaminyl-diphospho-decaprenol beta-1,3/1,4-galactofuranosyltransferase
VTSPRPFTAPVVALVLTYNAPRALARCLDGIARQSLRPSRVFVIDNAGSLPASPVALQDRDIDVSVIVQPSNGGPAGGHAAGLRAFLETGFPRAWVMDDDCVPEPDCLVELLHVADGAAAPALTFPTWIDEPSGQEVNWPAWCGFLIDRAVVEAVGLPREEFFWWAEDTEYLHFRIPMAGHPVLRASSARVLHGRVRAGRHKPPWKVYYEVRNSVYYRLRVQRRSGRRFYRLVRTLVRMLGRILLREDQRLIKLSMYGRGLMDGLLGRLGKRVPVEIAELPQP